MELDHRIVTLEASLAECMLANEALREEKRLLINKLGETNRLKDEFLAHISHELMTPLAVIKGSIDTLQSFPVIKPEERSEFMNLISTETDRLTHMIKDLLDIATIEGSRLELNRQNRDLFTVVDRALEILSTRIKEKNIRIEKKGVHSVYLSYIDFDRIADVITNLVNNAVTYTPQSGIIKIGLSTQEIDGKLFNIIEVVDNGQGIRADNHDSIFNDFYRTRNFLRAKDRDTYIKGVGIGLYLSRKIVTLHGGMMKLRSRPAKGSAFSIYLPVVVKREAEDAREP